VLARRFRGEKIAIASIAHGAFLEKKAPFGPSKGVFFD
jgi:hypothetical protein